MQWVFHPPLHPPLPFSSSTFHFPWKETNFVLILEKGSVTLTPLNPLRDFVEIKQPSPKIMNQCIVYSPGITFLITKETENRPPVSLLVTRKYSEMEADWEEVQYSNCTLGRGWNSHESWTYNSLIIL